MIITLVIRKIMLCYYSRFINLKLLNYETQVHVIKYHKFFYGNLYRSSHPEMFLGKGFLKISSKFTREHLCRSMISIKLLCSTFSWEYLRTAAYDVLFVTKHFFFGNLGDWNVALLGDWNVLFLRDWNVSFSGDWNIWFSWY